MFGFLFEMMRGQHGELPRRRHSDPVAGDGRQFLTEELPPIGDGTWQGRGMVPGQAVAEERLEGQSVADEMRQIVNAPPRPTGHPAATVRPRSDLSNGPSGTRRPVEP